MVWKGAVWRILIYYSSICLEGLRKSTRNLSQDSQSPVRDFNPGSYRQGTGILTIRSGSLVLESGQKKVDNLGRNFCMGLIFSQLFTYCRSVLLFAKHPVHLVPGVTHVQTSHFSRQAPETFTLFKNFVTFHNMVHLTSKIYGVDKNFCLLQNGGPFRNVQFLFLSSCYSSMTSVATQKCRNTEE